ncbi:MAG: TraB/GumN family protein [Acidobacteria bacterium]|nr:TraB/GumN family protein [Acidobacteriota bacterium]
MSVSFPASSLQPPTSGGRRKFLVAGVIAAAIALLAPLHAAGRAFAWKASSRGGVVYLVGSVHMLSSNMYPLNASLEAAYKDSDLLVEEVDLGDMMDPSSQMQLLMRGMLSSSQPLDKVVSASTYALLAQHAASSGLPIEPLKLLKPWMVALMVEAMEWQKAGLDPELGLDKHFYDEARNDSKGVQGLETADDQLSLFDAMTMDQQDHMLAQTLKDIDAEKAAMSKMMDAWRTGDVPAVERVVLSGLRQDPALYQRLLVGRNKNWMPKIEALFARRGHALVVVGAAHLVGPDGLVAMLKAKGYAVEQM